ncbi:hypothetical protein AB9J70_06855 [Elizabethkingia anophelis]|uniref:hypothetical protein n=1 Tax=Elizabethkingia anophelis TaxID=1117645 RepID=UPI0035579AA2
MGFAYLYFKGLPEPLLVNKSYEPTSFFFFIHYQQSLLGLGELKTIHLIMKKTLLLLGGVTTILLSSCGVTPIGQMGYSNEEVIKTVAIEQNCPKDSIKILDKISRMGHATYSIDACGKHVVYKRVGSVLMESSKLNETINAK